MKLDELEASSLVTGGKLLVALKFRMHWKGLFLKMYFFYFMYILPTCMYLHHMCACGGGGQKRVSDSLELKFSCHVEYLDPNLGPCRSNSCS